MSRRGPTVITFTGSGARRSFSRDDVSDRTATGSIRVSSRTVQVSIRNARPRSNAKRSVGVFHGERPPRFKKPRGGTRPAHPLERARRPRAVSFHSRLMENKPHTLCVLFETSRPSPSPSPLAARRPREKARRDSPPPPSPLSRSTTTVPYETAADAEAVRATLAVDNELQPDKVTKTLRVEGKNLVACVPRPLPPKRKNPRANNGSPTLSIVPSRPRSAPRRALTSTHHPPVAATSRRPNPVSFAPPSPRSWTFSTSPPAPSRSSVTSPSPRHPVARGEADRASHLG